MEVPTYTSEVVHPTADVSEPDSSSDNTCDWVIPEYTSTPFMPASTQTEDVGSPDMSIEPLRLDDNDEGVIFGEDNDENEGYLFADEDTNVDFEIDGTQDQSVATDVPDPYDKVYSNIPEETHMLKHVPDCGYCTAKKFEYELPGFCCLGGKVELAPLVTPPQLRRLWDSADSDARHFRDNIRFFNGHFSFTSLYCCLDSMTTNMRDSGIYTFRAQGMMYHNIKSFGIECGAEHKHLELYFYEDDPSLEHRYRQTYTRAWWIAYGDVRAEKVGKRTVLSPSFIGGPRDMRRRYMDAMALVQKFGKPDIFLTMTCNPNWDEIRRELLPGQTPQYRPDLVVGVFHAKLQELKHRLTKQDILGKVRAYVYVVEFQKRDVMTMGVRKRFEDVNWTIDGLSLTTLTSFGSSTVTSMLRRVGASRLLSTCSSTYTKAMIANKLYEEAWGILYRDFPEWYTWQQGKVWKRRKRNTGGQVGRIVSALPSKGERFYLRLLLNHVTGATSYVDLRIVDGDTLPSFREAAQRRGLLEADNTIDECLNEAALYQMPSTLRRLFAMILVYCEPNDVAKLWQRHLDTMSKDYHRITQSKTHLQQMVLIDIRNMLQSMGKDVKKFPLPAIIDRYDDSQGIDREIYEELSIEAMTEDVALQETLNEEQKSAYEKILSVVDTSNGGVFFVDGPGGTRKTYLYKALLAVLRSQDKIAVATATSGVAASIMPGGRTAHSRFKIPLTIDDGAICTFTKQNGTSKLLQKASLIIWDEASMAKRQSIEALDNNMRDIMGRPGLPFGGKTIVFGVDFRQVLPVKRKGSRAQIVAASLRSSYLWESMCHLKLVCNMRAKSDPWFAEYFLRVSGGTEEVNNDGDVCLPDEVCVPYTGDDRDLDRLIDDIYPSLNENMSNTSYITSRAILTTRNDWVDMINMRMIDRFQREQMMYHSFDTVVDDPNNYYPSEFLNTLTPNGLPPHVLKLKIGCPIMLLRNIDPANGLCNGTRLVHAGMRVFLPRIPLCPSDDEMFPFHFKRKQFSGQMIPNVAMYLPEPVFSHGQLYVALSRATTRLNVKVLVIPVTDDKMKKGVEKKSTVNGVTYTKNIVYKEVLTS
ncbi:hypothetical protein ZEAMMB73_Zm00001d049353 [Zea mays]|uniref:ATP-dependent DNA helicase n=1 Tax=Zea mays TaxID=4577 RepID=A0A1D6PTY1_MAIZE|nr:hypothetical protein ZEAMMB73_Zm00001d049353 [Zea mays]